MRITRNISVKNTGTMVVTTTRSDKDDMRDHGRRSRSSLTNDDRVWQMQKQKQKVQQQTFVDMAGQLVTIDHEVPADEPEDTTIHLPTKQQQQFGSIFRGNHAVPSNQEEDDFTTSVMAGAESTLSSSNSSSSIIDEETNTTANLSVDMTTSCDATATTTSTSTPTASAVDVNMGFDEMDQYFLSVYGMNDGCSIQSKGKLPSDDIFDVSTSAPSSPQWSAISSSSSSFSVASAVSEMSRTSTSTTRTTISRRRRHRGAAARRRRHQKGEAVHQILDCDCDCDDDDDDDEISCNSSVTSVTSAAARTIKSTTTTNTTATTASTKNGSSWVESMAEVCKRNAGVLDGKQWTPAKGWTSTSRTIQEEEKEVDGEEHDADTEALREGNNQQEEEEGDELNFEDKMIDDNSSCSSWANFDAAVF